MNDIILTTIPCLPIREPERSGWRTHQLPDRKIHVTQEAHASLSAIQANQMAKIVTLEEYLKVHRVGLTVATPGCFDLLGHHHVHLLEEAKKHGDTLVVLLNSDASVRRLKGDDRPVIPQDGRARVLAALACVGYVIVFDDDTPAELLRAIRPSVLVKGDQPERNTDGDEWCKKIVLVPPVAGSTTETIRRIRDAKA